MTDVQKHTAHEAAEPITAEELRKMTPEEGMIAGAEAMGVHIVHRRERFPIPGTKAEKRAERAVAISFTVSALCAVGFIVAFVALPFKWHLPGTPQNFRFYTPALGGLLAGMCVFFGIGLVLWAKWLMPEEEAVQDRHDEPSTEEDKLMAEATLVSGFNDTGLARRPMITKTLLLAGGAFATVPLVALVGAMIKKPGDKLFHTLFEPNKKLFPPNGHVPLVQEDYTRVGPDSLEPGGLLTVFPGVHPNGITDAKSPTLIIRLRPGQKVKSRKGQSEFGWPKENPEYVAYSKICTHAGCPASLYEQQTTRLLCPCHQSQFEVLSDAKPVFGPASRSLPKLPITVEIGDDGKQYFVATSDYKEAIGPAFWERP